MKIDNNKLKQILKNKGITKSNLSKELGISSRTIAKISKGENINKNVVDKILAYLKISYEDITETNSVLLTLQNEKALKQSGGLYHETQIKLTYNSNHI